MSSKQEQILIAVIGLVIGIPLSGALYAWAAQLNWNWFATTLGAPRIGFLQAYGLGLVVAAFAHNNTDKRNDADEPIGDTVPRLFVYAIARFVVLAGCGWTAHHFMVTP